MAHLLKLRASDVRRSNTAFYIGLASQTDACKVLKSLRTVLSRFCSRVVNIDHNNCLWTKSHGAKKWPPIIEFGLLFLACIH